MCFVVVVAPPHNFFDQYKEARCATAPHQHHSLARDRWSEGGKQDSRTDGQARAVSHLQQQQRFRFFWGYSSVLREKRTLASAPVWTSHRGWILTNSIRSESVTLLKVKGERCHGWKFYRPVTFMFNVFLKTVIHNMTVWWMPLISNVLMLGAGHFKFYRAYDWTKNLIRCWSAVWCHQNRWYRISGRERRSILNSYIF